MIVATMLETIRTRGLVTADELDDIIRENPAAIKLVDATYPVNPAQPKIGDAVIFDIDDIADPDSPMPHMLPSSELFSRKVGALGIGNDDFVIAYDTTSGVLAAARAWWMFRVFGHDNVAVLEGGLPAWMAKNYPLGTGGTSPAAKNFSSSLRSDLVIDYDRMKYISAENMALILDARPPERFGPDHIPNSANLPALSLLDANRRLRPTGLDVPPESGVVATCGSGVTACFIALALYREGRKDVAVYDGSWTEWSSK